jgi:hypothetical protein
MVYFELAVPGHAVVPIRGGPDVFENVESLAWTDQHGLRRSAETIFAGKENQRSVDFHFPFTVPVAFGDSPTTWKRLSLRGVAVYFRILNGVVTVDRIRVTDGRWTPFDTLGLGPLGLRHDTKYQESRVLNENFFRLSYPKSILNSLGVTVTVNFGTSSGWNMRFIGAVLILEN